jgi:dihydropteroate synthase
VTLVMGVLNVTPDSFSDGGRWFDHDAAIAHGAEMVAQGADVIDVGGESTRPGAAEVTEAEERRRILPVVAALAPLVRVSVDTRKAAVAEAAVAAGATMINDVSAALWPVAAATGAAWVAMHMRGEPATMQSAPRYDDVVAEVTEFLVARAEAAVAAGVAEVWVDPGIGFGKTMGHNLLLLRHLDQIVATGYPVMVGISRKSFLGRLALGRTTRRSAATPTPTQAPAPAPAPVEERLAGSLAAAVWAIHHGAAMVRVHDVAETVQAVRLMAPPACQAAA